MGKLVKFLNLLCPDLLLMKCKQCSTLSRIYDMLDILIELGKWVVNKIKADSGEVSFK